MAKVTSKRQVTVPKSIADRYGIRPGTEIDWVAAGDVICVIPPGRQAEPPSLQTRLALFDATTERQRARQDARPSMGRRPAGRGWAREDLYEPEP